MAAVVVDSTVGVEEVVAAVGNYTLSNNQNRRTSDYSFLGRFKNIPMKAIPDVA